MKVFQYIDVLHENDGIGSDIDGISKQVSSLGIENYIVARVNSSEKSALKLSQVTTTKLDINILHYGGYGFPIEFFLQQKGVKILRFHNVTPVSFFLPYLKKELIPTFIWNYQKAELELASLIRHSNFIWCDSNYNLKTLEKLGEVSKKKAFILPIQKDFSLHTQTNKLSKTLVFIGRWVPNKKLEDLLLVLYFLVKLDSSYTLNIVGKPSSIFERYNQKIINLTKELNLEKNIFFTENISETEKYQILNKMAAFLCMSEHEGFCIPILEAMSHNVLVFAYAQEAVKETCRESGILFKTKDFSKIAYVINAILESQKKVEKILQVQKKTLEYYKTSRFQELFKSMSL